ncbi:hypothetical protein FRUB_02191 [Fimbriiglobus ruber]|uniref:Uncharacterized protein n=1 Tax=Fimbriiglobus ruber TaxID=1908690 RepID=A0A225E441_9BACT|nr:hypothetical protein FRUB_02191 [Fimbriiglobus ruber]
MTCQILAGPVGDVQAFGDGLQARQRDDLGALEGGEISGGRPTRASSRRSSFSPPCSYRRQTRQTVEGSHSNREATSWTRSPAARAKTIRACCTWNHGNRRLRATVSRMGRSAGDSVTGEGLRPRMGIP